MEAAGKTPPPGFRILELSTPELRLRCAPALGGRVFSLVSRTGREWLWRPRDRGGLFRPENPRDFGTGTFAGLDECLPTIQACAWVDGRPIADHGEVWAAEWQVDAFEPGKLVLSVPVPSFGLKLTRTLTAAGDRVRFDYQLQNVGRKRAPALWAMHPLFAIHPGDRLELPPHVKQLHTAAARPPVHDGARRAPLRPFPEISPGVYLDRWELPDTTDGWLKAFTAKWPAADGEARIRDMRSGESLRIAWDARAAPYLGLWVTRGGYRGWHHVAIEPTNAPYDRVDAAVDGGFSDAVTLAPGASRAWWVEWRVACA